MNPVMLQRLVLAALAALALTLPARAEDKATLRLNWLAYGFHAPFYLGVARGLYKQQGIDLEIGEGQGSGRAVQAVAAGSDTFGLADGTAIVAGVSRGVPIQAVMGIMNRGPNGIIVPKASGVTDIHALAGQTIAATTGEASLVLMPAVLRAQKMAPDSIRFLRIDGAAKLVAVLEKRAAGMLGGVENQSIILEQRGVPVTTLLFSDLGANTIGLAILTTTDLIKKDPGLVRRFAIATRAAYELAAQQPDAAIDALLAAKPTLDRALSLAQLKAGTALMESPSGPGQKIGWMAEQDWTGTLALMKEFQDLQTTLPASAFWTNDFLPK
jgi:NitT/TauT family transport system substrate-binding protein